MSSESGLPNMTSSDPVIVTDAGLETWLVFDHGIDLPGFAAYPLAATAEGRALLMEYYGHYADIARSIDAAVLLDAPTWRANPDWADALGHDRATLDAYIAAAVGVVADVRRGWTGSQPFLIGGAVGPRGDGYVIDSTMDAETAADYHSYQIAAMATAGVDVVDALTLGYVDEAVGISWATEAAGVPVVISFTVETDGHLPSGDATGGSDRADRRGYQRLRDPLHGELCAPDPFRPCARSHSRLGGAYRRASSQRLPAQSRRARRDGRTGQR